MGTKHRIPLDRKQWTPDDKRRFKDLLMRERNEWYLASIGRLQSDPEQNGK